MWHWWGRSIWRAICGWCWGGRRRVLWRARGGGATGMAEVIRGALALYHETLPATGEEMTRYWLRDRVAGPRQVKVTGSGVLGNHVNVSMCGWEGKREVPAAWETDAGLVTVRG